jgi:hypothetical protein
LQRTERRLAAPPNSVRAGENPFPRLFPSGASSASSCLADPSGIAHHTTTPPFPQAAQPATYRPTGQTTSSKRAPRAPSSGRNPIQARGHYPVPWSQENFLCNRTSSGRTAALASRHADTTRYRGPRKTSHVIGKWVDAPIQIQTHRGVSVLSVLGDSRRDPITPYHSHPYPPWVSRGIMERA